ncbi:hypothetical protein [Streptomyces sp. NBC_01022]|uniref:hypothetical protein n=1 Tax=Streptomyces sp. NBC_01022 TaxID=2903723 RepID=UPI002DDC8A1E|nr:hypothetical protein [Streptomyces sp. NBC_01022]WRZ84100.1 hypothetical protein OG316_29495 [Streptomyces sp. NBC_01022]
MDRRKVIGIGVGLAVLPTWWALRQVANGTKRDWHTDTAPLERAFPLLGPLTDAKWVSSRDNDRGIPSPELVISGFARLSPGKLAELAAAHTFVSEAPADGFSSWFEKPLKGEGPENPQWVRSHELDREGSGYFTKLWFDRRSDTVRFRALNPYGWAGH